MNKANVFLYVKSVQPGMNINHVVDDIAILEGVLHASANENITKMVNLTYDSSKTTGGKIVKMLQGRGHGSFVIDM